MTEKKRFTDNGFEAIEEQSFTDNLTKKTYYVDYFDEIIDVCNKLWEQTQRFEKHNKNLMEENEQLRKSLKIELMAMSGNLCDACKHEEMDNINNWLVGIDFDVKCRKGHNILLDDEEQECEDFELNLKGDVE